MGAVHSDEYDIVVIGAGFGGASLAALGALGGRRVALIDKTPRAGGKTQTLDRRGYRYEMFGAVGIPAHGSRVHELVGVLGLEDRITFLVPEGNAAGVRYRASSGQWRSMTAPLCQTGEPEQVEALRRAYGVDQAGLDAIASMYLAAVTTDDAALDELWPDLRSHVIRTEPYGPRQISRMARDPTVPGSGGEAVGLAQVVGQVGRHKPDPRTPLPGLYLVGCDAGGRGAGTHQAVDSAFNVAALVEADLR